MRWGPVALAVVILSLLSAGCAGKATNDDEPVQGGSIRGVVLDSAVRPLEGALVGLTSDGVALNMTTDGGGGFEFTDLADGSYLLHVSKDTYLPAQQQVQLVEGLQQPEAPKVVLTTAPVALAFFRESAWDGFIECSGRVRPADLLGSGAAVNACDDIGQQDTNHQLRLDDPKASLVQAELTWESSQDLGDGLSFIVGPSDCTDIKWDRAEGEGPLVIRTTGPNLAAHGVTEEGMCYRIFAWVSPTTQDLVGVVVQQDFRVFFHEMYNFLPPDDWQFTVHGNPTPP